MLVGLVAMLAASAQEPGPAPRIDLAHLDRSAAPPPVIRPSLDPHVPSRSARSVVYTGAALSGAGVALALASGLAGDAATRSSMRRVGSVAAGSGAVVMAGGALGEAMRLRRLGLDVTAAPATVGTLGALVGAGVAFGGAATSPDSPVGDQLALAGAGAAVALSLVTTAIQLDATQRARHPAVALQVIPQLTGVTLAGAF